MNRPGESGDSSGNPGGAVQFRAECTHGRVALPACLYIAVRPRQRTDLPLPERAECRVGAPQLAASKSTEEPPNSRFCAARMVRMAAAATVFHPQVGDLRTASPADARNERRLSSRRRQPQRTPSSRAGVGARSLARAIPVRLACIGRARYHAPLGPRTLNSSALRGHIQQGAEEHRCFAPITRG